MLKLRDKSKFFNKTTYGRKCAEVFYEDMDNFSIVCMECEMKSFDFADFLLHFNNLHYILSHNIRNDDMIIYPDAKEDNLNNEEETADKEKKEYEYHDDEKTIPIIQMQNSVKCDGLEHNSFLNVVGEDQDDDWSPRTNTDSNDEDYTDKNEDISCFNKKHKEYVPKIFDKTKKNGRYLCCPYCPKKYKIQKFLEQHIEKYHSANANTNAHKCSSCESDFITKRDLEKHIHEVHGGFRCDHCNRVYKSQDSLQLHQHNHSGVRNYICDIDNCGKAFFNGKYLTTHKRFVHTAKLSYCCEICGYRTEVKSSLVIHKRTHTGEKPYACKVCGKKFASRSLVAEHMPIHSQDRPHKCTVCDATFSRAKALYHHKHLHLEVKRFLCKLCGKAYAQAAGISAHMRRHKV